MAWITTIPPEQADGKLLDALERQCSLYPPEYREPGQGEPGHSTDASAESIVLSHSLIPDALYHAFSTFGALMSPDLPLTRRQHEMITTVVSVANRCVY